MDLILDYLDLEKIHDVRLTFDALRVSSAYVSLLF